MEMDIMDTNEYFNVDEDPLIDEDYTRIKEFQTSAFMALPQNKWEWKFFGDNTWVIMTPYHISWWKRMWMKFFFGSKFKKLG